MREGLKLCINRVRATQFLTDIASTGIRINDQRYGVFLCTLKCFDFCKHSDFTSCGHCNTFRDAVAYLFRLTSFCLADVQHF